MPLYEYTCQICSNTFEKLRSVKAMDDVSPCPDCGSDSQRQLSMFASFSVGANGESEPIAGGGGGCCGGGGSACACASTTV